MEMFNCEFVLLIEVEEVLKCSVGFVFGVLMFGGILLMFV